MKKLLLLIILNFNVLFCSQPEHCRIFFLEKEEEKLVSNKILSIDTKKILMGLKHGQCRYIKIPIKSDEPPVNVEVQLELDNQPKLKNSDDKTLLTIFELAAATSVYLNKKICLSTVPKIQFKTQNQTFFNEDEFLEKVLLVIENNQ